MKCPTCGDELKVIVVEVPVYVESHTIGCGFKKDEVLVTYEEREEVCDCPRCTGGY